MGSDAGNWHRLNQAPLVLDTPDLPSEESDETVVRLRVEERHEVRQLGLSSKCHLPRDAEKPTAWDGLCRESNAPQRPADTGTENPVGVLDGRRWAVGPRLRQRHNLGAARFPIDGCGQISVIRGKLATLCEWVPASADPTRYDGPPRSDKAKVVCGREPLPD